MKINKGEIAYYIYNINNKVQWAVMRAHRDYEGSHGIGASWEVLDSEIDGGLPDRVISANQLDGIGVYGSDHFVTKDKREAIRFLMQGNNV